MTTTATSLKIPSTLKNRLDKLAKRSGSSIHAFMLTALEEYAERAELADQFLLDAIAADDAMTRSGTGYVAADVHKYVTGKVQGKKLSRPTRQAWRVSSTPTKR